MNYEKILLDLYERVVSLEEKISILENQLASESFSNKEESQSKEGEKVTRNVSRNYVMNQLKAQNRAFDITKGNRASKADILLKTSEKEITYTLKAKFFHSKSFKSFPSGWHTVHKEELANEEIDLFIFNVEFENQFYPFLFSRQELILFVQDKTTDQNELYHFYFHVKEDEIIEVRDLEKNASKYFKHWTLPSEMLEK